MSRVFVAHETALGRKVVIKVLLPELAAGVSVERFRREIQLAAQLQHPHIVPLLSAGESEGLPYFVMPLVAGESLRTRLARSGELPIAESVRILRDVVSALAYAHSFGVVHRDIKPDNVLISGGVAVVTDFGVAKAVSASSGGSTATALTSLGMALGTPAYMAPEQASGDALTDHRADIYALGVMAYEMLTGRTPFLGRTPQGTLAAHVLEKPVPVDRLRPVIPPMLATLVMSCLAKSPADRPQEASHVLHLLDAIATPTGGTVPTTVVAVPALSAGRPKRSRMFAVTAAAGAVLGLGAVLWSRHESRTTPSETLGAVPRPAPPPRVETPAAAPLEAPPPAPKKIDRPQPVPGHDGEASRGATVHTRRAAPADSARREPAALPAPVPVVPEKAPVLPGANAPDSAAPAPIATPALPPAPPAVAAPTAPAPSAATPTPSQPPPDPQVEVRAVAALIGEYARAVESESVGNLRQVYPSMTAEQQKGWEQFFGTVSQIKSQLSPRQIDVSGDVGSVLVSGLYTYVNGSTHRSEQQQVSFHASLRKTGGVWRIAGIR